MRFRFAALATILLTASVLLLSPYLLRWWIFRDIGGDTPAVSFEERKAWALKVYPSEFKALVNWLDSAPAVKDSLGKFLDAAPFEGPNIFHSCFSDGCWAEMNIEVRGERGFCSLRAPHVGTDWDSKKQEWVARVDEKATLTCNGLRLSIDSHGRTGLEGRQREFSELRKLAAEMNWRAVSKKMKDVSAWDNLTGDQYLETQLYILHALEAVGKRREMLTRARILTKALDAYFYNSSLETSQSGGYSHPVDLWSASIRESMKLVLPHISKKQWGEFGFVGVVEKLYQLQHASGGEAPKSWNPRTRDRWAEKSLGGFYSLAKSKIRSSPYFLKHVGPVIYIAPVGGSQNEVYFMHESETYGAFLTLGVFGIWGYETVFVQTEEDERAVPKIDPRAPILREPSEHAFVRSATIGSQYQDPAKRVDLDPESFDILQCDRCGDRSQ